MKNYIKHTIAALVLLTIVACTQVQQTELEHACSLAVTAVNVAGLIPGVGAIEPYVTAGCTTAQGLAKLASDPTSVEWVNNLTAMIKAL